MPMQPEYKDLSTIIEHFRRRISDLESTSRLGNSSINEGALIARDGGGVERARFGQLADSTFGVTGRIVGSDITGGTITGAVVTGSTFLLMSGATVVARIDLDGLWLTDPSTGNLVLIGDHIFGEKVNLGSTVQSGTQAANSSSGWVDLPGTQPTTSSRTGRVKAGTYASVSFGGTGNAANFQFRPLLQAVIGGAQYAGAVTTMPSTLAPAMAQQVTLGRPSIVTVPANTALLVKHQYKVQSGISAPSDWLITDYQTFASPA